MEHKIEFLVMSILLFSGGNVLAGLASFCAIIYYLSMTKINVVDKKHNGSWKHFFKSLKAAWK